ncbi:hypothetical protein GQ44DRAFT_829670 [Phaeosphaeriaceae sp. PMI808]|nr:hypothetical protein GQ44DRAFT_829670 [Phaeosphaeriaceae sp. PMI808]
MDDMNGPEEVKPSHIDIDKRGDILLNVGKDDATSTTLLVSSRVLSLASKVFEAMFNTGFAESQGLSSGLPRHVSLPDDDIASMVLLCKVVHMQTSDISATMSVPSLAKFAFVCDKYDCTNAVRPWGIVWISCYLNDSSSYPELLLTTSFLLDLTREFNILSMRLVKETVDISHAKFAVDGHEFFPLEFTNILLRELNMARCKAISSIISDAVTDLAVHAKKGPCNKASSTITQFIRELGIAKLLPIETVSLSVYQLRAKIFYENSPSRFSSDEDCSVGRGWSGQKGCHNVSIKAAHVKDMIDAVVDPVKGYCLDCVNHKFCGLEMVPCRVAHDPDSRF